MENPGVSGDHRPWSVTENCRPPTASVSTGGAGVTLHWGPWSSHGRTWPALPAASTLHWGRRAATEGPGPLSTRRRQSPLGTRGVGLTVGMQGASLSTEDSGQPRKDLATLPPGGVESPLRTQGVLLHWGLRAATGRPGRSPPDGVVSTGRRAATKGLARSPPDGVPVSLGTQGVQSPLGTQDATEGPGRSTDGVPVSAGRPGQPQKRPGRSPSSA